MTEMNSLTLNGKTYDCFVDGVARASVVVGSASGDSITVNDSSEQPLVGFNIYGKSTQAGTPTPDAPVDIKSVGDDGDVGINIGSDRFVLMTGDGLRGIQVTDKSIVTYTDASGKMWCADEVCLHAGRTYKRINTEIVDGSKTGTMSIIGKTARVSIPLDYNTGTLTNGICDKLPFIPHYDRDSEHFYCHGMYVYIFINIERLAGTSISDVLAYLSENPYVIQYILATPIETNLTEEQIAAYKALHTNRPNTTITNGENAYMSVNYIADAKAYIDNKVSGIIAATVE